MELKDGDITILCSEDRVTIEIRDGLANIHFVKATLTPVQFAQALSRLSNTDCKVEVFWVRDGREEDGNREDGV